jgi:hypothetical protein
MLNVCAGWKFSFMPELFSPPRKYYQVNIKQSAGWVNRSRRGEAV